MSIHYLRLVSKIIPVYLVHSVHVDIYCTYLLYKHSDHISQAGNTHEMEFLTGECLMCESRKTEEMPCFAMVWIPKTRAFKIGA